LDMKKRAKGTKAEVDPSTKKEFIERPGRPDLKQEGQELVRQMRSYNVVSKIGEKTVDGEVDEGGGGAHHARSEERGPRKVSVCDQLLRT